MEKLENRLGPEELSKNFGMFFDRVDDGLAALLIRYLHDSDQKVKITSMKGDGYIWRSKRKLWVQSDSQQCKDYLRSKLAKAIYEAIRLLKDDADRTARLEKHLKRDVHKVAGFYGIFEVARVLLRDDAFESQLNVSDEDVVPILDGNLVSLRDGSVRARTSQDLFSFECPVQFLGKEHPCAHANRFFKEVFIGDPALIDYAQQLLGYCLSGSSVAKAFFIFCGKGNNGKTTLMEMMKDMMGATWYSPCDKELFLKQAKSRGRDVPTPTLMVLNGRRLVSCCETSSDQILDEPQVKLLTGGDTLVGRKLHKDMDCFTNRAKVIMLTNDLPLYNKDSVALQQRIKMLPFLASFQARPGPEPHVYQADKTFVEVLRSQHLSEVFTLLVLGATRWYAADCNLVEPKVCSDVLNAELEKHNHLDAFVSENYEHKEGACINAKQFHVAFKEWCTENEWRCPKPCDIEKRMVELGYPAKRTNKSRDYVNIALKS
jgi:putative DNA primase/helicase